jgi:hypothetical protein
MPKNIDVAQFAEEAAESIINGNETYVLREIAKLSKTQAMAVTAYTIHYLSAGDRRYQDMVPYILRRLSDNV